MPLQMFSSRDQALKTENHMIIWFHSTLAPLVGVERFQSHPSQTVKPLILVKLSYLPILIFLMPPAIRAQYQTKDPKQAVHMAQPKLEPQLEQDIGSPYRTFRTVHVL